MVSTTRRFSKVKRNFSVFRRPVIFLVLVVILAGFLVHHASLSRQYTQIREVFGKRQSIEESDATTRMRGTADLLRTRGDQTFNIDDIMVSNVVSSADSVKLTPIDRTKDAASRVDVQKLATQKKTSERLEEKAASKEKGKDQGANSKGKLDQVQETKGSETQGVFGKMKGDDHSKKDDNKKRQNEMQTIRPPKAKEGPKSRAISANTMKAKNIEHNIDLSMENQEVRKVNKTADQHHSSRAKYLIYLCDRKAHCYGLGDRQRAIVATYYLAELTGRRFGLIMSAPSDIRDFYEPNLVKWDIAESDLPKNATKYEISALGPKVNLHLDTIDFNSVYPQDVVYVRTNQVFWHATLKNPLYAKRVPGWAKMHHSQLIAAGWLRLMKPTPLLRGSLNSALVDIARKMQEEAEVAKQLNKSRCCKKSILPKILPTCSGNQSLCSKNMTALECCDVMAKKMFAGCPEVRVLCSGINSKDCEKSLSSSFPNRWDGWRIQSLAYNYCAMSPAISKLNITIDSINKKKGFDLTDMNLICAHIRLGHSKTFPFETHSFNEQKGVSGVWEFLKNFARKGYHMYLASDAQEVKDEAKTIFGERLHMADAQIVHIGFAVKGQDLKAGLQFTLAEQLLLTTSCREIVVSHSGYSGRAVEIRNRLMGGRAGRVYHYHDGIVT
ncbi:hypothetical protein RRG08_057140 [Elysia crispata]|uniref:Uncharacterized protein n=1 Tax=Elysia crispata TaxID=231223 RepID=A0AAE1DFY6_9GAST|nr:hypothetical protein RRG08_057140 [Elysia crispata]